MVGISKPHLFSPGRLHSSWTICIITLCGTNLKSALDVERLLYSMKPFRWVVPVCPTLRQPRRLCWGKNAVGRRVSRSGSPQCWGCVCTEPDPWGRRRPESGHRDLLRSPQQSNYLAWDNNSANCCRRASEVIISRYSLHSRWWDLYLKGVTKTKKKRMPNIVVGWSVGVSGLFYVVVEHYSCEGHHRFNKQDQSSHIAHGDTSWKRHGHLLIRQ